MRTVALSLSLFVGLAAATPAHAIIYLGNPELGFRVDRPQDDYIDGTVTVDRVVVHHCGGGSTTYSVSATVDPVAGHKIAIGAGDHCGVTFHWDTAIEVDGPTYVVEHVSSSTSVWLDDNIPPKLLSPCTVTSGTMPGGCPWLLVHID